MLIPSLKNTVIIKSKNFNIYMYCHWIINSLLTTKKLTILVAVLSFFTIRSCTPSLLKTAKDLDNVNKLLARTNQVVDLISEKSSTSAATQKTVNFSRLPNLTLHGSIAWYKQTLLFNNPRNGSKFIADIYLPKVERPAPVIVISPGFMGKLADFVEIAQQLASYGFVVVVPDYNNNHVQKSQFIFDVLTHGVTKNRNAEPQELINRVLNIKFLLDELQRRSQFDSRYRVNLQQVGVMGFSIGSYAAMALAGGSLNFRQLQKDCVNVRSNSIISSLVNLSRLLQCRLLELPQKQYYLQDERIKAVILVNSATSSIFGKLGLSQVRVPVMLLSGSDDIITPALTEQIQSFNWLNTPHKYLVMFPGGTHLSFLFESRHSNAFNIAFWQIHLAGAKEYQPFLSSAYAEFISRNFIRVSLVKSLSANEKLPLTKSLTSNQSEISTFSNMQSKVKWLLPAYKNIRDYLKHKP
jgi:predicted dienelactone hydrolase